MEKVIEDKIYDFLTKLNTEIDIVSFVDIDNIDIDDSYYSKISKAVNPYGDGTTSEKIKEIILANDCY